MQIIEPCEVTDDGRGFRRNLDLELGLVSFGLV